jgi:hypothetical protein
MSMKRWVMAACASCALLGSGPAFAEPRPLLVPTRDVTVQYQVTPHDHGALDVRVAVKAGGTRLRITSDTLPTTVLVNRDTEKAAVMLPLLRAYSDIKIGKYDPENTVLKGATFSRGGHDRVAGHECTAWHAISGDGSADACITGDGVILRGALRSNKRGEEVTLVASRVDYAPVPDADFAVPPDFQRSPFKLNVDGFGK